MSLSDSEATAQKADLQAIRDAKRIQGEGPTKKKNEAAGTVLGGVDGSMAGTGQSLGGVPGKTVLGG